MKPITIKTETDCTLTISQSFSPETGLSGLVFITDDQCTKIEVDDTNEHIVMISTDEIDNLINYLELIKLDLKSKKFINQILNNSN